MADSDVIVKDIPLGKKIDNSLIDGEHNRQRVTIGDPSVRENLAEVKDTAPTGIEHGLVTRVAGSVGVTGPLTDTQLRASPVSILVSSSALPTNAATETTLLSILSAILSPITVLDGHPDPQLDALTDAQLRASAVPVSATALPLPSGAATEATGQDILTAVSLPPQVLDTNNTVTITSTSPTGASPGVPFVGDWTSTRAIGYIRQLTVLAAISLTTLGGTFTFQFSEDGINPTINEERPIASFDTVRDFDLINAGAFYRVIWEPDRPMVAGEFVFINTIQRRVFDGSFVRLANQEIEEANGAMPQTFSYLKAFGVDGKSQNIRASEIGQLEVKDSSLTVSPSGSLLVEGIRDDVSLAFTSTGATDAITHLVDLGSVNGSASADPVEGQVVFSTTAAPGAVAWFCSDKTVAYEAAHGIRGEQTIEVSSLPTGDAFVEWGFGDALNAVGWRLDASGLSVIRRKNGVIEDQVAQASWNRDQLSGAVRSKFRFNHGPQAVDPLKNNLYRVDLEWLGVAPIQWLILGPTADFVPVHVLEYPNQGAGSTVPDPDLPLFVRVSNDTTVGGVLSARSGSWRAGLVTGNTAIIGKNPDGDFATVRVSGRHSGNSTTTPLVGDAGSGEAHIFRGVWFEWQGDFSGLAIDMSSDVSGTLYIDFSQAVSPTNGSDVDVDDSRSVSYDPSTTPLLRRHLTMQSRWVRIRYVNGLAAQSAFVLDTAFLVGPTVVGQQALSLGPPDLSSLASMHQSVLSAERLEASEIVRVKTTRNTASVDGLNTHITGIDPDIKIGALRFFETGQLNVSPSRVQIPPPTISNVKGLSITNRDADTDVFWGDVTVTAASGDCILARGGKDLELDGSEGVFLISEDVGATTVQGNRFPGATANNVGVVNPNNILADDTSRATFDDQGDNVQATTFTAAGVQPDIESIRLKCKARKGTNETTEQVAHVATVSATAGNVGVIVSPSVTAVAGHFYLVAISRRNAASAVSGVSGMGLTWTEVSDKSASAGDTRISVYRGSGTPTTGAVTATFSATATNCVIAVSSFSGVNLSSPIENFENLEAAGAGTGTYADTIIGTNRGLAYVAVSMRLALHTPGSGFTEEVEARTGVTTADASLAVNTLQLTTTGAQSYSGTFNVTSQDWTLIAVSLLPATAVTPILTLTYKVGAEPIGPTSLTAVLSDTSDTEFSVDITGDRIWVASDIANTVVTTTSSTLGSADAEVNAVWLDITEVEADVTARCTYCWLAEP